MTTSAGAQSARRESFAAGLVSLVLAGIAVCMCQRFTPSPRYADLIVGSITWRAQSKLQDLIAAPVFIVVLLLTFLLVFDSLNRLSRDAGKAASSETANLLIWWSIPCCLTAASMIYGATADFKVLGISGIGIILILFAARLECSSFRTVAFTPNTLSFCVVAAFLLALMPLELGLMLASPSVVHNAVTNARFATGIFLIATMVAAVAAKCRPALLPRLLPSILTVGQIGLAAFFLALYPARLLQISGQFTRYNTTIWLKIAIGALIVWTIVDVIKRYRTFASDGTSFSSLVSPMAFFALLIALRVGTTVAPSINPDDYHFGESILGWWSYLHGALPYVDYMPPHGIIEDDLTQAISFIFYDGTAASMSDAVRLTFVVLALPAFLAIYRVTGSVALAFSAVFLMNGKIAWLYFVPFICLWFNARLSAKPLSWLIAWLISLLPLFIGIPAQALLLMVGSAPIAVVYVLRGWREGRRQDWIRLAITVLALITLIAFTPLRDMLVGALQYILLNGPINQVAYGVPWSASWDGSRQSGLLFEVIRMSWLVPILTAIVLIYKIRSDFRGGENVLLPAVVSLLFSLLLIPYSMGRIDAGNVSRPGLVAIFEWSILLPMMIWPAIKARNRSLLILTMACACGALGAVQPTMSSLVTAAARQIATPQIASSRLDSLSNIGRASIEEGHWLRLQRLSTLLRSRLSMGEGYLDLTSRNAQYFYMDRVPPISVTAPYNMVAPEQQRQAIEKLDKVLPQLALLSGDNIIHDGGGLALRNPLLYRFVLDRYVPRWEDGFIVGYPRRTETPDREQSIAFVAANRTDGLWQQGVHRNAAALVVGDSLLVSKLKVGATIQFTATDARRISRVDESAATIWLDGPALDPAEAGYPKVLQLSTTRQAKQDYELSLYERATAQQDFGKIPVSWGRSMEALSSRMRLVSDFSTLRPITFDLTAKGDQYEVAGADPQFIYDLSQFGLAGREAGLLSLKFTCEGRTADPAIQVYWWGDEDAGPSEKSSIRFTADTGTMLVPLDASPRWLAVEKVKGIRLDLINNSACRSFRIGNLALYQRRL